MHYSCKDTHLSIIISTIWVLISLIFKKKKKKHPLLILPHLPQQISLDLDSSTFSFNNSDREVGNLAVAQHIFVVPILHFLANYWPTFNPNNQIWPDMYQPDMYQPVLFASLAKLLLFQSFLKKHWDSIASPRSQQFTTATHVLWNSWRAKLEITTVRHEVTRHGIDLGSFFNALGSLFLYKHQHIHIFKLVKITLAYEWVKPVTRPLTWRGKTPENPQSPILWSVLSWLWRAELGSDSLCPRHTSPHSTADITSKHMGFQAAIPTMLGTQCWVSVVLGWTPHPDTWQTMLSWLYRNTGGFWRCSLLLWLTLWIQECC